ncbi:MAG: c-type cytochrome [Sulfuritalea sp.]|nr:c-type cytochrome [Sulfuritalea sp.]MDP1981365.1 c-type cytochrome [Sulfuritalea sp.]
MTMKWRGWALATGVLAVSAMAQAAPPTAAMLSNACAGCHGTHGGSAGPSMPSLAGQSKEAIVDAMTKFKSGVRPATVMGRLAKGYSDAEITAMGEFFSKQKLHATTQTLDAAKIAKGASLQESNCGRCHIEDGKEGKDDTPAMASQWLPYLQIQMADYLSGKRKMPEKMEEKVKPMSKADLEALLHFYASVK